MVTSAILSKFLINFQIGKNPDKCFPSVSAVNGTSSCRLPTECQRRRRVRCSISERDREMSDSSATVAAIVVYPIKSCRGISVSRAPISSTGFRWDRLWMIVKPDGRMYTQRVDPKLALVQVDLPREAFSEGWEPSNDSYLVIRAPGMSTLKLPLANPGPKVDGISVWEWTGSALDEGDEAAQWFSSYIGKAARLVRFDAARASRDTDPDFARGYRTMFSDGYPFLIVSQGSINELNNLLPNPVSFNRFRPNIVIEGCGPFEEDLWKEIKISKSTFNGVKLCSRCKVPSINQETGDVGPEVPDALKKHRAGKVLRPNGTNQGKVYLGQNMVCRDSVSGEKEELVKVGDLVYVVQKFNSTAEAPA